MRKSMSPTMVIVEGHLIGFEWECMLIYISPATEWQDNQRALYCAKYEMTEVINADWGEVLSD